MNHSTDSCLDKLETYKVLSQQLLVTHMIPRLYIYMPQLVWKAGKLYVDICGVIWENIGYWYNRFYRFL